MVIKMTKYSFILLSGETEGFLERLQSLGVVDITRSLKPVDDESTRMLGEASDAKKALAILNKCKENSEGKAAVEDCPVKAVLDADAKISSLSSAVAATSKQVDALRPWGDFDSESVASLKDQGLTLRFYTCLKKKFDPAWGEIQPLQVISEDDSKVYFVTVAPTDGKYSFPIEAVSAPESSVNEAEEKLHTEEAELSSAKDYLASLKDCKAQIQGIYDEKVSALDLYLANAATEKAAEDHLTVFTGFAPTEDDERLKKEFDTLDIWYSSEPATKEDNPPIKLKNNWFARNFEVLTGMYGMPVYDEFDPTPVLAPFFMLFFAICLGDAGYGLLLLLIAIFMKHKMADSSLGKMHRLIAFLGIMTMIVGSLSGVFFGVQPHQYLTLEKYPDMPGWLLSIRNMWAWLQDGKIAGFPTMMVLAIGIGVFHICLAMIIKTVGYTRRFGFKETISTWGWTVLIVGGIIAAALLMTEVLSAEAFKWVIIVLAVVSGLGIYIFNKPGRNPLLNIGSGLWDTYNMVTGLMSDTLSYIRLYALGLAGGMLGNAFNLMGNMILEIPVPGLNWVFFIVILIFGHILNLAMSCLGAFVHPLRLTFVEYFKNSGYEGTGLKYNPLKK